eukprot:gene10158-biopygen7114
MPDMFRNASGYAQKCCRTPYCRTPYVPYAVLPYAVRAVCRTVVCRTAPRGNNTHYAIRQSFVRIPYEAVPS